MIIISKNIVLSEIPVVSPNAPRIGYRTLLSAASVEATYEDPEYPARNLGNPSTSSRYKSTSISEQYITIAPGVNDGVDYIGFAKHNFGSTGISYIVQGSDDGSTWDDLSDEVIPNDDSPHVQLFTLAVYAYYRVKLTPDGTAPICAVMYIGRMLAVQRNLYVGHTPITMGRDTTVKTRNTENGNFLGRAVLREFVASSMNFQNLTPTWYRNYFEPFVIAARTQPFFWAWRPLDYPLEVGYVWTTDDINPTNQRANGMMQVSFKVRGIASHISDSATVIPEETT